MRFLLILLFTPALSLLAQSRDAETAAPIQLKNKRWKSNIHCFEHPSTVGYELSEPDSSFEFQWGNFITFHDATFTTSYSAPCGNDCFTSVSGSYHWVGASHIEVFVDTIQRNGFCQEESEQPQRSFGVYRVYRTNKGLRLEQDQK